MSPASPAPPLGYVRLSSPHAIPRARQSACNPSIASWGGFSAANVVQVSGLSAVMCGSGGGSCDVGSSAATCPAGAVVLGGGWDGESSPPVVATVGFDNPIGSGTWDVIMANNGPLTTTFHAVATCATASGASAARAQASRLTKAQLAELARDLAAVRLRFSR
jgi:hypothetical protein